MNLGNSSVLVGPARSGKREILSLRYCERLVALQQTGQFGQSLWLAPSRTSADDVSAELARLTSISLLQPGVFTFAGFADSVIQSSHRPVRPASTIQKKYLLQLAISHVIEKRQLSYFRPVADTPGFLVQLDQWIADKKRHDVWAEHFKEAARSVRDRELALLYGEYQRLLTVGELYDEEGRFWAARDILAAQPPAENSSFGQVVVYGFSDFTAAQIDILKMLGERSEYFRVALTADSDLLDTDSETDSDAGRGMLFLRTRRTYRQLLAALPGLELASTPPDKSFSAPLRQAERCLFSDRPREDVRPKGWEILAAAGSRQELELVAAKIKSQLLQGNARPEEVAIVTRDPKGLANRLGQVLDDYGVPYWLESRTKLTCSALVRSLHTLLRLQLDDWPFRCMLELVCDRTIAIFDQPAESRPRVCLEQSIRAAQIPSGRKRLLDQLQRWTTATTTARAEHAQQAAVAYHLLQQLADLLDELPAAAEISQWTDHLQRLLQTLGMFEDSRTQQLWTRLSQELFSIQLAQTWATKQNDEISLRQMLQLMQMAAEQTVLPASHGSVGRVRVLSMETARHLSVPHLYIIDVGEQSFSSAPNPGQLDVALQRSADQVLAEQADMMFLFYTLITRATESVTLSYPALDEKGQVLPPSPMLEELQRCFDQPIPRKVQSPGLVDTQHRSPLGRTALRTQAVLQAQDGSPDLLASLLGQPESTGKSTLAGIGAVSARAKRDGFSAYEGLLHSSDATADLARRFDTQHLWSPSQLEEYGACPFRFFANQLLSLTAPKDIAVANDLGRRGSILHQVLAEVHQKLSTEQLELPAEESLREVLVERFRQALAEEIEAHPLSGLEESLREIERREIDGWANQYADQELHYRQRWSEMEQPPRPAHFEVRFGPDVSSSTDEHASSLSTTVPFELDLGEQQIRITGQIDRIDVGRIGGVTVFNIIDYKSGKDVTFKSEHLISGKQLQLPLYALAAEQLLLADQQAHAMAAGYWSIQGKGFEKGALHLRSPEGDSLQSSAEWDSVRDQLIDTLRELVLGVQRGDFPVYNTDDKCTSWCEHRTICRVGQIRSLEKQWPPSEGSAL